MAYSHTHILKSILSVLLVATLTLSMFVAFAAADTSDVSSYQLTYDDMNKAPGGTYGYLTTDDDDFAFNLDGRLTSIRFFGVSYSLVEGIPSRDDCMTIASELFDRGVNLIRFTDVYEALIKPDTGEFDEDKIELFDVFMYELKRKGIYAQLDFFTAKAMGATSLGLFFDNNNIGKAQRFLKNFFSHTNDSGVKYYADPMVVTVKLYSGATAIAAGTDNNAAYTEALTSQFNRWLLAKYTRRSTLRTKWTHADGVCELLDTEDPEKGTVGIGVIGTDDYVISSDTTDNARQADYMLFLASIQTNAYTTLSAYIRKLGYASPIVFSDVSDGPLSTELSGLGDTASTVVAYSENMTFEELISDLMDGSITNKPFIACYDTSYDCGEQLMTLLQTIAVSSFQGYDSFILGNYSLAETEGVYNLRYDEDLWAQLGFISVLFRNKLVAKAYYSADYVYTADDTVAETGMFGTVPALLKYLTRVGLSFIDNTYPGDSSKVDVVFTSGNTSGGTYSSLKTTGLFLQSFNDFTDAYFTDYNKKEWYNAHTERNKMEETVIGGVTFHIGEKRVIASSGAADTFDVLATALSKLNENSGEGKDRLLGSDFNYSDGVSISDSGQIIQNTNNGTVYINAANSVITFGSFGTSAIGDDIFTYSGTSENGFIAVRSLDNNRFENAEAFHVFTVSGAGTADTAELVFVRDSVTCRAYALNDDGTIGNTLDVSLAVDKDENSVVTVKLDGSSNNYYIVFTANETSNVVSQLGLEEKEWGLVWPENDRPNLVLLIGIPAVIFLAILYAGLKISERMKLKREEMLRLKTMEKSKTSLAAFSLAHGLSGAGDADLAKQMAEEGAKPTKPVIKGRNYLDDDESVYDINSMFNDSVWVASPVCDSDSFSWDDFKVAIPKTPGTENISDFNGTFTHAAAPEPLYFDPDDYDGQTVQ